MKIPKGFGGQGFQGVLAKAQEAMARAQTLEQELASQRIDVDKGVVKATFNGVGELVRIKLDPVVVDPEDIESLEDLIVSAVRDGFEQATALRNAKVQEIMPDVPGL
jgi:nucleoid-associated protein EbfC